MRFRAALCLAALIAGVLVATARPAGALAGGPDAFGYRFKDSAEPGGPAFNFEDISATGTSLLLGDDQVSGAVPIGFTFDFYGTSYTSVFVSSNGFVTFTSTFDSGCCSGQPTPSSFGPNNLIAGYWSDLWPPGGSIRYQTLGTAPSRRFIVQFTNVPHCCSFGFAPVTMQFKLFEGSGQIEVQYASVTSDGDIHSAGIEDAAGSVGLQYLFGSFSLSSTAVRYFIRPPPTPPVVTGPGTAFVNEPVVLEATSTDPGGLGIAYTFDWGDGSPAERVPSSGFVPSGTTQSATHAYANIGTFTVTVVTENELGDLSDPTLFPIEVSSHPPVTPPPPGGPPVGTTLLPVEFRAGTVDPDGDPIAYEFDWGDGSAPERVPAFGFVASGTPVVARHLYDASGMFLARVRAFDAFNTDSGYSAATPVEVIV